MANNEIAKVYDLGISRITQQSANEILTLFRDVQTTNVSNIINDVCQSEFPPSTRKSGELEPDDMYFFKVNKLSFDEEIPRREAMENVIMSLENEAYNFVYVITGNESGNVDLHIGVVKNPNENPEPNLVTAKFGKDVYHAFEGNFNGSTLEVLQDDALINFATKSVGEYSSAGMITGIPSVNEKDAGDKSDFQGIDRLITSMMGKCWRLVIVCEPVGKKIIDDMFENIYEVYNHLTLYSKQTRQYSKNNGASYSEGTNKSHTDGGSKSEGSSKSETKDNHGETWSHSKTFGTSTNDDKNWSDTHGSSKTKTWNAGTSESITLEKADKHAAEMMKYIDDELLERLKVGRGKGLFRSSVYYMAKTPADCDQLKAGIMALFQGNKSTFSPLYAQKINVPSNDVERKLLLKKILCTYQNHATPSSDANAYALSLLSRPYGIREGKSVIGLNTYLTAQEVSIFAGLPMKEVAGLPMKESVDFGLNEKEIKDDEKIKIGNMIQKGREIENLPFNLSRKSMEKHTFIAGVTGGGKTNTCYILLQEADTPFLVIEPAKTEYRSLINYHDDICVFTLGNEQCAPFRINPFEVIKGENISSHIDMVKATFTSAFPMEASMPQLLEEAIIKCYEEKGWDINGNTNYKYGDKAYTNDVDAFPTLSDLLAAMPKIVEEKKFSADMAGDYEGSLKSRLSNLTKGTKGAMLDVPHSVDFDFILRHKVIIEMEEIKSPEHKALLMGFILTRLSEKIKLMFKENQRNGEKKFRHLTLIEEAHRLLAKVDYGDSGSKKSAVETFTDLLAEVRKYGEGLIVVDQIPNKLAPEVLKNTNTKIIHKILAKDDKEAVGDTMLMDDKQKEFLSALEVGEAIVFNEHTSKPVHIKIKEALEKDQDTSEEQIKQRFESIKENIGDCYDNLDMMKAMTFYKKVIDAFKGQEGKRVNKDDIKILCDVVKKISDKRTVQKKQFSSLTEVWCEIIGKHDARFVENLDRKISKNERIKILVDLFVKKVRKDDFNEGILKQVYEEKKLEECF